MATAGPICLVYDQTILYSRLSAACLCASVLASIRCGEPAPRPVPVNQTAGHRIRRLREIRNSNHTITVIAFDYSTGVASRIVTDEKGKLLHRQQLRGRPQSSREEFQEAVKIIRGNPPLAGLMAGGAIPEGGFIVDGPPDHPMRDRYIQIRLLTPDRSSLLRVILVDLTAGAVASAKTSF